MRLHNNIILINEIFSLPEILTLIFEFTAGFGKTSILKSFTLLFLGIVIASLVISSTLLYGIRTTWMIAGIPGISFVGYLISGVLGMFAAYKLLKD